MESFAGLVERRTRLQSKLARCLVAEFFCTAFLMFAGFNCNAQMVLSHERAGNYLAMSVGWGLSITFAIQLGYNISGAHMNPAVSLFMWSLGKLPLTHFGWYSLAQTAGAFCGSALSFLQYYDLISAFDGGVRTVSGPGATAALFATYPHHAVSLRGAFVDQVLCAAVLCIVINAVGDPKNHIPRAAHPPLFGATITLICLGFGLNAGNAMNPARDFGPRLFTFVAGYGWEVFSYRHYNWFWIPVVCPFLGAMLGTWAYQVCIKSNIDVDEAVTLPVTTSWKCFSQENTSSPSGSPTLCGLDANDTKTPIHDCI